MDDQQLTDLRMFLIRAAVRMQSKDPEDLAHDILLSAIRLGWGLNHHTPGFWRTAVKWAVLDRIKKQRPSLSIDEDLIDRVLVDPPYEPTAEEIVESLRKISPSEVLWLENYYRSKNHTQAERAKAHRVRRSVKEKLKKSKQVWC